MRNGPRVVLLGKQGAGKGTQAERLALHFDVAWLSTGNMFRAAKHSGTQLGALVARYMDHGELVPDEVVVDVVDEVLKAQPKRGFVLDGFPRTEVQGRGLDSILADIGHGLDAVIDIAVPTDVVLNRLAGRRVCSSCGATYHVDAPPAHPWVCDVCGGEVVQRADDTEEAIARRLDLYERETLPLAEFYRAKGLLTTIDGVGEPDDVFTRLRAAVEGNGPFSSLAEATG